MRRFLWNIYAWPFSLLIVAVYFNFLRELGLLQCIDMIVSIPSFLALHLHIWDRRIGTAAFWKPYLFLYFAWELIFNLFLSTRTFWINLDSHDWIFVPVALLPFYVGIIRYSYRKWTDKETPNHGVDSDAANPAAQVTPGTGRWPTK
jgi:hypothetical protein